MESHMPQYRVGNLFFDADNDAAAVAREARLPSHQRGCIERRETTLTSSDVSDDGMRSTPSRIVIRWVRIGWGTN